MEISKLENKRSRERLFEDGVVYVCRFPILSDVRNCSLVIMRGVCMGERLISRGEAEMPVKFR